MEEEKAAEYYDELVRKGGNAAKFKQGLGFGSHSTAVPSSEKYGSLNNFVKQASPGRAAALEREIIAETIQEKLKKRKTDESSEHRRGSRPRFAEGDGGKKPLDDAAALAGRKRALDDVDRDRRKEKSGYGRRSSSSERHLTHKSEERERRRSTDPSRQKSTKRGRPSPAVSSDSSSGQSSYSRSRRRRRRGERDRSVSPGYEKSASRRSDRRSTRRDSRSPSLSSDERRRPRDRNGQKNDKRRHYSPALSTDSGSGSSESYESRKRRRSHRDRRVSPANEKSGSRRREGWSTRRNSYSPSRSDERRKLRDSSRQKPSKRRHYSPAFGSDSNSGQSYESRKRRRNERDSSSRRRDRRSVRKRSYSPSRSDERRRGYRVRSRTRSRSRSRGRYPDRRVSYRRERSPSPYNASRRERRDEYHRQSSTRNRYQGGRDEPSRENRYGKSEAGNQSRSLKGKEKPPERDYSKLIPNFDSLTPAEKIKAKMKLQLSETVVKDQAKGMTDEWERFDFDKNAPLDDDAKLDYFGDGTDSKDDTAFLNNTGSSFPSSSNQVKREALVTAAHDEAIFGPAGGLSLIAEEPVRETEASGGRRQSEEPTLVLFEPGVKSVEEKSRGIGGTWPNGSAANGKDVEPKNSVVSDRIIATQNTGTWQERAQKLREKRNTMFGNL